MALSKSLVEAELSQRLKSALGTFTTTADLQRLQMAYLGGLRKIWHAKEWRFKHKTATLVTTAAIGTGPYPAPADFYKLAQEIRIYRFAHDDNQILAPVKDALTASYFLWIDGATGSLYFVSSPGDSTLTLNYQPGFDNDVANIAATVVLFPSSLMDVLYYFTKANLYEDLPQFEGLVPSIQQQGMAALEVVWQDYNQGQARQRQMAPRGLNGGTLDGMADPIPLRGPQRWWRRF